MVVTKDKVVSLTYVLHDQRGEIFEYTDLPVHYLHGSGQGLFDKIERALDGHDVGDVVEVELEPAEGFGEHDDSLVFTDELTNVPPEFRQVGAQVEGENDRGETLVFVVTRVEAGEVTVDANHPLAGQTVRFTVTIRDVRDATEEERQTGHPAQTLH
ncbi:MAG: FKBP-type peptidyl-prolyl cis-trans isomerase [Gammaproteobacteria bacterium]|nr:FKBP-type peptidyl-prolyl cis-trans isomerase [Gammaproteobacteria bacterium]